jgi:hypothetical protein
MTFAWYGHLKFTDRPLWLAVIASWFILRAELQLEALWRRHRMGSGRELDRESRVPLLRPWRSLSDRKSPGGMRNDHTKPNDQGNKTIRQDRLELQVRSREGTSRRQVLIAREPPLFRFWHKAGVPIALSNLCYRGNSGHVRDGSLGCVLINPALKAPVAECPLRPKSDRDTALPRYDAMCHKRP